VLNHKQHEVMVTAKISTTGDAACNKASSSNRQEEAFSCGDFFVAMGDDENACSWYYNI
jgi:hypothetical protein